MVREDVADSRSDTCGAPFRDPECGSRVLDEDPPEPGLVHGPMIHPHHEVGHSMECPWTLSPVDLADHLALLPLPMMVALNMTNCLQTQASHLRHLWHSSA